MAKAEEKTTAAKGNGNGNGGAVDDKGRKLYTIVTVLDGEKFERKVPLIGIPFWVPQKREDQAKMIVGTIEDLVTIPAQEQSGFQARQGILLKTKDGSHFVVPAGAAIERQIVEMDLAVGERIIVEFNGYGRDKGNGRKPALRMNVSKCVGNVAGVTQTQTVTV